MTPELFGLSFLFAFALALFVWQLLVGIQEVREGATEQDEGYSENPLFKLVFPFAQAIAAGLERRRGLDPMRADLRERLVRAGKADAITPDELLGFCCVCGVVGLVVGVYFMAMLDLGPEAILLCGLLVAYLPLLQLGEQIKRRQNAIRRSLPYALDLVCLAVEAGLDFSAALGRIAERMRRTPLRDELRLLTRDLTMGKSRPQALRDMEKRVGIEELTSVVSSLVQADELGSSLGPTLRIQSRELQRKRFQRAEKKAMQAPVLMLIPLVLFIFPLVFLIVFTPIVIKLMDMGTF